MSTKEVSWANGSESMKLCCMLAALNEHSTLKKTSKQNWLTIVHHTIKIKLLKRNMTVEEICLFAIHSFNSKLRISMWQTTNRHETRKNLEILLREQLTSTLWKRRLNRSQKKMKKKFKMVTEVKMKYCIGNRYVNYSEKIRKPLFAKNFIKHFATAMPKMQENFKSMLSNTVENSGMTTPKLQKSF